MPVSRQLIEQVKRVAVRYYEAERRPLGVTGEIAECEAIWLLGLQRAGVRERGFDAIGKGGRRYQIKARCIQKQKGRQRVGSIRSDGYDAVLLVLYDGKLRVMEIWEVSRQRVEAALQRTSSGRRRRTVSVREFMRIGRRVWPKEQRMRK